MAITRAKFVLIIVGNANTLYKDDLWNKLITFCHDHEFFVQAKNDLEIQQIFDTLSNNEKIPNFYRKLIINGEKI